MTFKKIVELSYCLVNYQIGDNFLYENMFFNSVFGILLNLSTFEAILKRMRSSATPSEEKILHY